MTPISGAFGLDISSTSVEGIELTWRRKTGYELRAYNRVLLPPGAIVDGEILQPDVLRSALASLIRGARPAKFSKAAVVSLPEAKVYFHTFEFPASMHKDQVHAAMPYEVEGVLPVELKDMETDLLFHHSRDRISQHVLFVAVPRKLAEEYTALLESVGIEPVALDTESASLARSLVGSRPEPVLLADIGGYRTTLIVVERGLVHGAVSIPNGGSTVTEAIARVTGQPPDAAEDMKQSIGVTSEAPPPVREATEEALKPVIQEMKQLLRSHETHTGRAVNAIALAGGTALLPGLDRWISVAMEREVTIGDPFAMPGVRFPEKLKSADVEWLQRGRLFFAASVGLAMRGSRFDPSRQGLNLLPTVLRRRYTIWRENLTVTTLSFLSATVCTLLLMVFGTEVLRAQFTRKNVQAQAEPIRAALAGERYASAIAEANAANAEVKAVDAFSAHIVDVRNLLENLRSAIVPNIRLSTLEVDIPAGTPTATNVNLQGVAATREDFLAFERAVRSLAGALSVESPLENLDRPTAVAFKLRLTLAVAPSPPSATPSPP